jgi:hypothetical protein
MFKYEHPKWMNFNKSISLEISFNQTFIMFCKYESKSLELNSSKIPVSWMEKSKIYLSSKFCINRSNSERDREN